MLDGKSGMLAQLVMGSIRLLALMLLYIVFLHRSAPQTFH